MTMKDVSKTDFKRTEVGAIPADWSLRTIGELCSPQKQQVMPNNGGTNRYIGLEHLDSGHSAITRWGDESGLKSSKNKFEAGDILYGKLRPYLDKAAIASWPGMCSTDILVLSAFKDECNPEYLGFLLHTQAFLAYAKATTKGVNHPRTSWADIKKFAYGMPDKAEQEKIAEVLSKLQKAVERQAQIVANLRELKAATISRLLRVGIAPQFMFDSNVFDKVIYGEIKIASLQSVRLVATHIQKDELARSRNPLRNHLLAVFELVVQEQIPTESAVWGLSNWGEAKWADEDEGVFEEIAKNNPRHAEDALIAETCIVNNITLVTEDKGLRKKVLCAGGKAVSVSEFLSKKSREYVQTEIGEMPGDWQMKSLTDCCEKPQYGYTESSSEKPIGPKFLRITDLTENGVDWANVPYCKCSDVDFLKHQLKSGDILVARIGATTGKNHLIVDCPKAVFASYLIRLRARPGLVPEFLSNFMDSDSYWKQVRATKGQNLKGGMSGSVLSQIRMPFPSEAEQKEISGSISVIDRNIRCAVEKHLHARAIFSSTLNQLMTGRVRV